MEENINYIGIVFILVGILLLVLCIWSNNLVYLMVGCVSLTVGAIEITKEDTNPIIFPEVNYYPKREYIEKYISEPIKETEVKEEYTQKMNLNELI